MCVCGVYLVLLAVSCRHSHTHARTLTHRTLGADVVGKAIASGHKALAERMDKWEKDAYRRFGKRPRREHKKTSVCPSVWASNELKQRQKVSFQHHKMASHTTPPPPHTHTDKLFASQHHRPWPSSIATATKFLAWDNGPACAGICMEEAVCGVRNENGRR